MRRASQFALICTLASCVWLKSVGPVIRDSLFVAVPTAIAAAATSGASVAVQFIVTLGTCVAAKGVADVASRDSGETIGAGAQDAELRRLKDIVPDLKANAIKAHADLTVAQEKLGQVRETVSWFSSWWTRLKWALGLFGAVMVVKYTHPKSRAARNFWGGILAMIRGDLQRGLALVRSATGWTHTPETPPKG